MKWVALLLQLISFRSSLLESRALLENARAVAEKGKRAALFSAFALVALVYFLVGSVLAIVELGLQLDHGSGIHFSGLMASAIGLLVLSALILGVGSLLSRDRNQPEPPPPSTDMKELLENFALTFISRMMEQWKENKGRDAKDESGA